MDFFSIRKHTATVEDQATRNAGGDYTDDTPDDDSDNIITSFNPESGADHRSTTELNKKDRLIQTLYGGRVDVNISETFRIGAVYYSSTFDIPINPEVKNNYYYKFRGDKISQVGTDFDFYYGSLNFFGEIAFSFFPKIADPVTYNPYDETNSDEKDTGMGMIFGTIFDSKIYKVIFLYRRYDPDFYSYENNGFAESDDINEEGYMLGTKIKFDKDTKFWGYIDVFRYIWRRYDEGMPTYGYEAYTEIEHRIFRKFKYKFRIKIEEKDLSWNFFDEGSKLYWTLNDWRVRNQITWEPTKTIKFTTRYEYAYTLIPSMNLRYDSNLILGDVRYKPTKRLTIYMREVFFDTVYGAGIWEYENDLPGYMASNAFYGKGHRMYIMVKDEISKKGLTFALKVARTHYYNVSAVSTILDTEAADTGEEAETILGDTSYDFRAQVEYKF